MIMTTPSQNINNRFFEGLYKDVWKKLINPGLTKAECEFIRDIAALQPGATILDLMCGYGRHAIELARSGCEVTAVDNLKDYIDEVRRNAEAEGLAVKAYAEDVLSFQPAERFDAVICMGNSLAFFNKHDTIQLLKKVAAALKPGGKFIISSWMIAEIAIRHFRQKDWMEVEEYKYLLDYRFQFHPSRIESEHTIIRDDGATEVIHGVDYIFTLSELEEMFDAAGLRTQNLYATPRKKPFTLGDQAIYIVAESV